MFGISIKNSFFTLYPLIKSGLYQEIFDIIIDIMKKREDLQFKITNKIKNLEIGELKDNLFHYSYDSKTLKSLFKNNISKDNISYITAHSSFKGEIYENIIYELLMDYALNNDDIKGFVLKGPYQDMENKFIKSGLLIDRTSQIVFKSAYKDISEFDAMFFTENKLYFVEMSTSKKTSSLNKRLAKKYALLKMIFPSLEIKCFDCFDSWFCWIKQFSIICNDLGNKRFR